MQQEPCLSSNVCMYDSDGEIGPFYDAVQGENEEEEGDEIVTSTTMEEHVPVLEVENARKMKVADIRSQLESRGLSKFGNKAVLGVNVL